jgi:glycosyltransferase involved in cell wall biosynthesis
MKILYCIPDLSHGGAERQLSYLAAELSRKDHVIHVASRAGGANLDRLLESSVVWHELAPNKPRANSRRSNGAFGHLRCTWDLIRLIRNIRPDMIQTILGPMDIAGGIAARLTGTPWVIRECSSATFYSSEFKLKWKVRKLFGRLCDMIIANSRDGAEYWSEILEKVCVVPNGVPVDRITSRTSKRPARHKPTIIFVGRIVKEKNLEGLVRALAVMEDSTFRVTICGDGDHRPAIEALVSELGLDDRVHFTGFVDTPWELIKQADVLVSLSLYEGCPNVVLEAMASGCPVIVSDIPAHREILDETSAVFVHASDTKAVAAAIQDVLGSGEGIAARARSARLRAETRPIGRMAEQHARLYSAVVETASAVDLNQRAAE